MEADFQRFTNAYIRSCPDGVRNGTYGRDVRRPIHDAIQGITGATNQIANWCMDIGLCVENGKLCAIYNPSGGGE